MRYRKQPSPKIKREWLKMYYEGKRSQSDIAHTYDYPVSTVNRVLQKMELARKTRSDKGKKKSGPHIDLPDFDKLTLDGESAETQLEIFIHTLITGIQSVKKIKASQSIAYVNQLTNALKKLRSIQFAGIAKSIDAKIVINIIRRFEPHATEMRVIEIFKEEFIRLKKSNG